MFSAWWGEHVEGQFSEFVIVGVITFVFHEIVWLCFNVPYMFMADGGWLQRYRINKVPKDPKNTAEARWSLFRAIAWDHMTQLLPTTLIFAKVLLWLGFTTDAASLPSWRKFLFQFVVFNVIEDTGFYWVHRWMHTPWAYRTIHKKHHEFIETVSLAGNVAHPIEYLLNFLLPLVTGPVVCAWFQGTHIITFWAWIAFREMRGTDAHSGYHLPFHPLRVLSPIYLGPLGHDFHHSLKGRNANLGGYVFWDWLCGTDRAYKEHLRANPDYGRAG